MAILKVNTRTLQGNWPHWRQANFSNYQNNIVNVGGDDCDDMSYDIYDNGDDDVDGDAHDGDDESDDVNDDDLYGMQADAQRGNERAEGAEKKIKDLEEELKVF